MQVLGLKGILHKNTTLPTKRDHGFITQVKDNFEAFGIANVMQRIDPHVVGQLMEKMWNIDGMWATFSEGDYGHKSGQIEVLTSLLSPSTFWVHTAIFVESKAIPRHHRNMQENE